MAAIGFVNGTIEKGFVGQLKTLSIRAAIEIRTNRSKRGDVQPDYRIYSEGVEYSMAAFQSEVLRGSKRAWEVFRHGVPVHAGRSKVIVAEPGDFDFAGHFSRLQFMLDRFSIDENVNSTSRLASARLLYGLVREFCIVRGGKRPETWHYSRAAAHELALCGSITKAAYDEFELEVRMGRAAPVPSVPTANCGFTAIVATLREAYSAFARKCPTRNPTLEERRSWTQSLALHNRLVLTIQIFEDMLAPLQLPIWARIDYSSWIEAHTKSFSREDLEKLCSIHFFTHKKMHQMLDCSDIEWVGYVRNLLQRDSLYVI